MAQGTLGTQGTEPLVPLSPLTRRETWFTDTGRCHRHREVPSKSKQKAIGPACVGGSPDPLQKTCGCDYDRQSRSSRSPGVPCSSTQTSPGCLHNSLNPHALPSWLRHCGWNQKTTCLEPPPSKAFHSVLMGPGAQAAPPSGGVSSLELFKHIKRVPFTKIALLGALPTSLKLYQESVLFGRKHHAARKVPARNAPVSAGGTPTPQPPAASCCCIAVTQAFAQTWKKASVLMGLEPSWARPVRIERSLEKGTD